MSGPAESGSSERTADGSATLAVRSVLVALRSLLLRFVLPLVGLGLVLWAAEVGMAALGYHEDVVRVLRMAIIPLYILIAVMATRKRS